MRQHSVCERSRGNMSNYVSCLNITRKLKSRRRFRLTGEFVIENKKTLTEMIRENQKQTGQSMIYDEWRVRRHERRKDN